MQNGDKKKNWNDENCILQDPFWENSIIKVDTNNIQKKETEDMRMVYVYKIILSGYTDMRQKWRKIDEKSFEMRRYIRMQKINWIDRVSNDQVAHKDRKKGQW